MFEESDECLDLLEYLKDGGIRHDPGLLQEAKELASIFAAAVRTARQNTRRQKNLPDTPAS